jgi:hypothetical protein
LPVVNIRKYGISANTCPHSKTFSETGLGTFCITDVNLTALIGTAAEVKEGTNATLQVITNGDPDGGLYNCADITFTANAPIAPVCTLGKGVKSSAFTGPAGTNANETSEDAAGQASSSLSTSATATSASTAASSTAASSAAAASTSKAAASSLSSGFGLFEYGMTAGVMGLCAMAGAFAL